MGSFDELMKQMPRVKAEAGQYVVIETTKDGITISEVVLFVEQLSYSTKDGSSKVKLNVFNPPFKDITKYEL